MELEGTFHGGVIVPDSGCPIPEDGTRVQYIQPNESAPSNGHAASKDSPGDPASDSKPAWSLFADLVVDHEDAPVDLAAQHEHYRLGIPKR